MSGAHTTKPWDARRRAVRSVDSVSWKMSLYSRTAGRGPSPAGLIMIVRIVPSGPGTCTSRSWSFTSRHPTGRRRARGPRLTPRSARFRDVAGDRAADDHRLELGRREGLCRPHVQQGAETIEHVREERPGRHREPAVGDVGVRQARRTQAFDVLLL